MQEQMDNRWQQMTASAPSLTADGRPRTLSGDRLTQIPATFSVGGTGYSGPVMFTTGAVPQVQTQESIGQAVMGLDEENEFLHSRVAELEEDCQDMQQQVDLLGDTVPVPSARAAGDISMLQQSVKQAEVSESQALRAHESRVDEINELQEQLSQLKTEKGMQAASQEGNAQILELYRELAAVKAAEGAARHQSEEQTARIEEYAKAIQSGRTSEIDLRGSVWSASSDVKGDFEQKSASAQQEKEFFKKLAEQKDAEIRQLLAKQARDQPFFERKVAKLAAAVDVQSKQLAKEGRSLDHLKEVAGNGNRGIRDQLRFQTPEQHIQYLTDEMSHLQASGEFHRSKSDVHQKEVQRLRKHVQFEPALVPPQRYPLKALETKVLNMGIYMMCGICSLPVIGAIAALNNPNYMYWLGGFWPWMIILGCGFVFIIFIATMVGLLEKALPEHRSLFTMAVTWATFAALLGLVLVPVSLMANREALEVASTISQGCLTAYPQSELLVDYSQVLYNIRLTANCTNAESVTECEGYAQNKYTIYLEYLENNFQCGPLCPESPPPAEAVIAPSLHSEAIPDLTPGWTPPRMFGPPLQNAHGSEGVAFLHTRRSHAGQRAHMQTNLAAMPPGLSNAAVAPTISSLTPSISGLSAMKSGVMDTALPHMQAQKLFSHGKTRATCFPLISTRLQVLVATFGGLWYWQGMAMVVISLMTWTFTTMSMQQNWRLGPLTATSA